MQQSASRDIVEALHRGKLRTLQELLDATGISSAEPSDDADKLREQALEQLLDYFTSLCPLVKGGLRLLAKGDLRRCISAFTTARIHVDARLTVTRLQSFASGGQPGQNPSWAQPCRVSMLVNSHNNNWTTPSWGVH